MSDDEFWEWVASAESQSEHLVLDAHGAPNANMVWLPSAFATQISVATLQDGIRRIAKSWQGGLSPMSAPFTFYCWYDDMAGQLRMSAAPCTPNDLPFGGPAEVVSDLSLVLGQIRDSDGFIPWEAVVEIPSEEEQVEPEPQPFPVWASPLR